MIGGRFRTVKNKMHLLARGILANDRNKVLVAHCKGSSNVFLPGGHIEFGEKTEDCLKRELKEELGIEIKTTRFLGAVEHIWPENINSDYEINLIFEITCPSSLPKNLESKESHLEFSWLNPSELKSRNLQPDPLIDLISRYLEGQKEVWWASTLK